jgi:hypothetical protein
MRTLDKSVIEVTIVFNDRELERTQSLMYIVKWVDGKDKVVTSSVVQYATQSIAQALQDVAVLSALNPFIKTINMKVI